MCERLQLLNRINVLIKEGRPLERFVAVYEEETGRNILPELKLYVFSKVLDFVVTKDAEGEPDFTPEQRAGFPF